MTVATSRPRAAALTATGLASTFDDARPLVVAGSFRRAAGLIGDVIGAVGVVLCIPFVILAVCIPIALVVRLLLWVVERF